jgi:ferredoxin/flavodoxin---NADP+ reductase
LVEDLQNDELIGEMVEGKLRYYPTTTREETAHMGRITDNLSSGKVFEDLGLPRMNPEEDRAMVCGSLDFNIDVNAGWGRCPPAPYGAFPPGYFCRKESNTRM